LYGSSAGGGGIAHHHRGLCHWRRIKEDGKKCKNINTTNAVAMMMARAVVASVASTSRTPILPKIAANPAKNAESRA